jgi:hypothetical protein
MKAQNQILIKVLDKQKELQQKVEWTEQLIPLAPPVLWFGDLTDSKDKILTIGANPSRREFLVDSKQKAIDSYEQTKFYNYLSDSEKRFYHYKDNNERESSIVDEKLQNAIINSYNAYFEVNPYNWFGKKSEDKTSYNVEGFLNGLEASYYGLYDFRAIHIDLFPYPTLDDFSKIYKQCREDIFNSSKWGEEIIKELLKTINPKCLIVFGIGNWKPFTTILNIKNAKKESFSREKRKGEIAKCTYWLAEFDNIPVVGLSVNLGNPRGFDKENLIELGRVIKNNLNL